MKTIEYTSKNGVTKEFSVETLVVHGVELIVHPFAVTIFGTPAWDEYVNGCGSSKAKIDFIPDRMWGLKVTPV